ncbi:MAG: hypothetical protein LKE56_04730 [Lactobacillus delbrueckii]|nr:hypothetical protein [Lactobacillus delbrueckii]
MNSLQVGKLLFCGSLLVLCGLYGSAGLLCGLSSFFCGSIKFCQLSLFASSSLFCFSQNSSLFRGFLVYAGQFALCCLVCCRSFQCLLGISSLFLS